MSRVWWLSRVRLVRRKATRVMMIVHKKAAELADTVRLCSYKVEESRGTSTRVINARKKMAKATKTLGSCLDKVEESMGAPIRVVMA